MGMGNRCCAAAPERVSALTSDSGNSLSEEPVKELSPPSTEEEQLPPPPGDNDEDGKEDDDDLKEDEDDNDGDNDDDYTDDDDEEDEGYMFDKEIIARLIESDDPSIQLVVLTELCEALSFSSEGSISGNSLETLAPVLVTLAKNETSPDIMLFSIRAITYLCEASLESSGFLVGHGVIDAICASLMAIQYLDVAEQCLQALEKISRYHPLLCLQAGVIMIILSYIDFFCASDQRLGINIIANICKKLPSYSFSKFMEAVPVLCNLLQYEDKKLVENVATCLIWIVKRTSHSSEMLDELCKHGLIHQVANLIALNSGNILSQPFYIGLIRLLSQLASSSSTASNTLFELNISNTLKHILSSYDQSHSKSYSLVGTDAHYNQIYEVMKFLNALLPPLSTNGEDNMEVSDKERTTHQPELLRQFGADILPVLVQVVNSGADLYVCYGCLSVINKIVYFSRSDNLVELLNNTNISSFLAGIIARKERHLLMLALRIVKTVMQELPDAFLNSFIKEGIVHAIDALVTPEKCSQFMLQKSITTLLLSRSNKKKAANDAPWCLCYAYNMDHPSSPEIETCKLEETSVHILAKRIMTTYFTTESQHSEFRLTRVLQKLKSLGAVLSDMVNTSVKNDNFEQEKNLTHILSQIMEELNGDEPVSTFELIESGIVRSLVDYLSNGCYQNGKVDLCDLSNNLHILQKRFEVFSRFCLSSTSHNWQDIPLAILIQKLQSALSSLEHFPVILHQYSEPRETYATIPSERSTTRPCLKVRFIKERGEATLCEYTSDVVTIEAFTSLDDIERHLWPEVSTSSSTHDVESATESKDQPKNFAANISSSTSPSQECEVGKEYLDSSTSNDTQRLMFYLDGGQLDRTLTLYQAILQLKMRTENDLIDGPSFWNQVYEIAYRKDTERNQINVQDVRHKSGICTTWNHPQICWQNALCFSSMLFGELPCSFEKSSPIYEILTLLKILDVLNKSASHLVSLESSNVFAEGHNNSLDSLMTTVCRVPPTELVSLKLTGKLEQQMQEFSIVSTGSMPSWCVQLMEAFPFLFSFEARCRYFQLSLYDSSEVQPDPWPQSMNSNDRRLHASGLPRKKFKVCRSRILESAAEMMGSDACGKAILEVEYPEEVGTGLGPTMEFFTMVSHEFQKVGLGMWREDQTFLNSGNGLEVENSGYVVAPFGLFPRPWSAASSISNETQFCEVIKKFVLLGQFVAKALQDGRVLDLSLSVSFYKLILEQELNLYDIHSFDPGLGRALVEFQALVDRTKVLGGNSKPLIIDSNFQETRIEDLYLDFTLPGYPDYKLTSIHDHEMVNISTLEEYVSLTADATVSSGIFKQVEAFKSGFDQVLPLRSLRIFTVEELDQLLCGERSAWNYNELLDHIKFDHGYTASSPPIINLLEIMQELEYKQQGAFLQFVTGAPRLPPGGLAALNPKLTVVCKHCNGGADGDLPSVMTCANYLKLPPYSSKEIMRERVLYAITEGQGSFHLS